MRLLLVGDTVLARPVAGGTSGSPVAGSSAFSLLSTGDLTIANLEAPLVDTDHPAEKEMTMRLSTTTARHLRELGVDAVSLATNHALDHGVQGLLSTMDALDAAGIHHAGGGRTLAEADAGVVIETDDGTQVAVLSYCSTLPPGAGATSMRPGIAPLRIDQSLALDGTLIEEQPGTPPFLRTAAQEADALRVEQQIRMARTRADRVVVCLHWGVPFAYLPTNQGPLAQYQQSLGRRLIDAGADVVVGTHPHCLHPVERWHEGLILYSIGNFVFHAGEITQPEGYCALPYQGARLLEGAPWYDSALFEVEMAPGAPPRMRIIPVVLDAEGEPLVAGPDGAARIRRLVESYSREVDPSARVDDDGSVTFGEGRES